MEVKIGNIYVGSVTGEMFRILFVGKRHPKAKTEVQILCSKSSKKIRVALSLVQWMLKSGGLVTA